MTDKAQKIAPSNVPVPSVPPTKEAPKKKIKLHFAEDFLLAGVAAGVSKTGAAPIERIKLLVQTEPERLKTGALKTPYNGLMDCARRTLQEEGFLSFWKGNVPNVIRYFPTQALNFAIKPRVGELIKVDKKDPYLVFTTKSIISGGIAGIGSLMFVYPLDFVRTRLAADAKNAKKGGTRQFNGMFDVFRKIIATDGIAGLYRGFAVSSVGIFIYRGLYFGLYDAAKLQLPKTYSSEGVQLLVNFLVGWLVTNLAGLASYPIDTIRRRMMMTSGEGVKYRSSFHAFADILKTEGVQAYFKGAGANILRGIAGAGVLAGFDFFKKYYFYLRTGEWEVEQSFSAGS